MYSSIHHVVPDLPPPHPTTTITRRTPILTNTSIPAAINGSSKETLNTTIQHTTYGSIAWLILIIVIIIMAIAVAILAIPRQQTKRRPGKSGEGPPGWLPPTLYNYVGLKASLRKLFLLFRAKAEETLGRSLTSKTASEIASMLGSHYRGFADNYNEAMYGPKPPDPSDIDRIKRLAGVEG